MMDWGREKKRDGKKAKYALKGFALAITYLF